MNHRACVVEVVERVPEADVAIVAARVGERLSMPPERVRKLIDGRTGPITRALRADKADAIAQTFEAAGVRVVIRPAEPEELEGPPPPAPEPEEAPEMEGGRESEPVEEPEPVPVFEPEPEPAPEPGRETMPDADSEPEPDPEPITLPEGDEEAPPPPRPARPRVVFGSAGDWGVEKIGAWTTGRAAQDPAIDPAGEAGAADDEASPVVGRASRRSRRADTTSSGERPVPVAWRGLGPEPAGPARPADAPVPRRRETEPSYVVSDPRLETVVPHQRRRGVLLALLAVAVAGFVFAQWWVASRAGAAVDASAGFHAYRDGDFAAARRYWGQLAAAGDPTAQFMLGYLAEAGLGAPWSARAAAAWYRAAATAGHAEAAWRLGRLYEAGLGVAPDDGEARRWFRTAADLAHGEAAFGWARSWMRELGMVWSRDGVATWPIGVLDELAAAFERAAALGFHEAAPYAASLAAARAAGLAEP